MPGRRRLDPGLPRWLPVLLLALTVALAAFGYVLGRGAQDTQKENGNLSASNTVLEEQRNATADQASTLAAQVAAACKAGGATATDLQKVGACQQAQQVQVQPVPGLPGRPGPAPTPEQISGAVSTYLFSNPPAAGRSPTAAEVAAAVTAYLTANPPQPGRAPTTQEISDAVATYFLSNPVRDGVDGKDGRAPTAEEIQAAVNLYVAQNPPPRGAPAAAFTFTDSGGVVQQCTRTPDSADEAPTYSCAPEE